MADQAVEAAKPSGIKFPGFYRRNNVPHWQRIHQTNDGVRQWNKGPRAKLMLYPYYALMIFTTCASMWMMCRQVVGRKTWWGK